MPRKKVVADAKAELLARTPRVQTPRTGLSTGSTLLNLACTGDPDVGFLPGHFYYLVGDSSSGKSFLSLTCFAEACRNPAFDDYRLVFDNAENGALMDYEKFFGRRMASRVEPPCVVAGQPRHSNRIEEFYFHLDSLLDGDRPVVYVLDSMDALSSESADKKFKAQKKAGLRKIRKAAGEEVGGKDEEVAGSMGDGKAKVNSSNVRMVRQGLERTDSILLAIGQTRDNIGFDAKFNPKTRSGGHALTFYASLELWSSVGERIRKNVRGKPRLVGIKAKIRVKKNRVTGKDRTVLLPIYHSTGFDDTGSMVDYLIDEGVWKETNGRIEAGEFGNNTLDKLIQSVEADGREAELRALVKRTWDEIEQATEVRRKRRYE